MCQRRWCKFIITGCPRGQTVNFGEAQVLTKRSKCNNVTLLKTTDWSFEVNAAMPLTSMKADPKVPRRGKLGGFKCANSYLPATGSTVSSGMRFSLIACVEL
jgi:hypothetical protein